MAFRFRFDLTNGGPSTVSNDEPAPHGEEGACGNGSDCNAPALRSGTSQKYLSVIDVPGRLLLLTKRNLCFENVPLLPSAESSGEIEIGLLRRVLISPPSSDSARIERGDIGGTLADAEAATKSLMESQNTDIIRGRYEGGLKVWECSIDLCRHLADQISSLRMGRNDESSQREEVRKDRNNAAAPSRNDCRRALSNGGSILELGCGHGLPGCLVFREAVEERKRRTRAGDGDGGSTILFSDYNEFVLRDATLPNVFLNVNDPHESDGAEISFQSELLSGIGMVAGDWMELSARLKSGKVRADAANGSSSACADTRRSPALPRGARFDLILASETTYTYESTRDTAVFLGRHLKVETGVGLVATKRYYFGVGGGADAFRKVAAQEMLERESGWDCDDPVKHRLLVETVREYDNGAGNIREILRVRVVRSEC